jgi:hypothetical protein
METTLQAECLAEERGKPLFAAVMRYTRTWLMWLK